MLWSTRMYLALTQSQQYLLRYLLFTLKYFCSNNFNRGNNVKNYRKHFSAYDILYTIFYNFIKEKNCAKPMFLALWFLLLWCRLRDCHPWKWQIFTSLHHTTPESHLQYFKRGVGPTSKLIKNSNIYYSFHVWLQGIALILFSSRFLRHRTPSPQVANLSHCFLLLRITSIMWSVMCPTSVLRRLRYINYL